MEEIATREKEYYEKIYQSHGGNTAYIWRVAEKEIFGDFLNPNSNF